MTGGHWASWEDRREAAKLIETELAPRLPEMLKSYTMKGEAAEPELVAEVERFLTDRAAEIVALDSFGPFRWGKIIWENIDCRMMWDAIKAAELAIDARRFPTLDAWLAAMHRGELMHQWGTHEPLLYRLLPPSVHREMRAKHTRRWKSWPLLCACGQEFLPPTRKAKRCPDCRRRSGRATSTRSRGGVR